MSICAGSGDANGALHGSANTAAAVAMEPTVRWGWQGELRGAGGSGAAPSYQQTERCWSREEEQNKPRRLKPLQSVSRDMFFFFFIHVSAVVTAIPSASSFETCILGYFCKERVKAFHLLLQQKEGNTLCVAVPEAW